MQCSAWHPKPWNECHITRVYSPSCLHCICHQVRSGVVVNKILKSQFLLFVSFPNVSELAKHCLPIICHVHILQVSPVALRPAKYDGDYTFTISEIPLKLKSTKRDEIDEKIIGSPHTENTIPNIVFHMLLFGVLYILASNSWLTDT